MSKNKIPHQITLFFNSGDHNKSVCLRAKQTFYYPYRLTTKDLLRPEFLFSLNGMGIRICSIDVYLNTGEIKVISEEIQIGDEESVTSKMILKLVDELIRDDWEVEGNVKGLQYDGDDVIDWLKKAIVARFEIMNRTWDKP